MMNTIMFDGHARSGKGQMITPRHPATRRRRLVSRAGRRPVALPGGIVSGGSTFATFGPMSLNLKKSLSSLPTADQKHPYDSQDGGDDIAIEVEDELSGQ